MGKVRSIRGGRRAGFSSQLMSREPAWEIRQVYGPEGSLAGDLIVLYTPKLVRAVVILRAVPPEQEWEALDTWVLAQLDNYERRYVVDYYEGRYVTGVEGPAERPEDSEDEEEGWTRD
ncbi:MAG TPA: hypothetical protein VD902_21500 [Symbiobacteriaceae bacterium]|nr:hypothetical protein [Symbiobacteriaceae bacterium]